jgi:hypothetical protein
MKNVSLLAVAAALLLVVSACTGSPQSPTSPSATRGGTTAATAADGSTLKVKAPVPFTPTADERVDSRRPALVWGNSVGTYAEGGVAYQIQVLDGEAVIYDIAVGETPNTGSHTVPFDLAYNKQYSWRIRAALGSETGPWSNYETFFTPLAPVSSAPPTTPSGDGTVGPARSIPFNEAFDLLVNIHNGGRFNLGRNSSRDYRINFLWGAVAAIHYGHPRWNPKGPDSNWCVKDAGEGRPPSDDVIVICSTRDAWDLVSGAGTDGYAFHKDYLGRLPSVQNVYAPPRGSLNFLPQ